MSAPRSDHPLFAFVEWTLRPATRVALLLGGAILLSALGVVSASHQTRVLFADLERARIEHDRLLELRGRLLLERSTFSAYNRVEAVAVDALGMQAPTPADMRLVTP